MSRRRLDGRAVRRGLVFATLLGFAVACLAVLPLPRPRLAPREGPAIADVHAWGYQLQRAEASRIGGDVDLMVIDHSADGTAASAFSPRHVAEFRARAKAVVGTQGSNDTRPRLVLAYMSVGEAEAYRYYWSLQWSKSAPSWLGPENKDWKRNYLVRFWEPGWQQVIVELRPSALRRLLERPLQWHKPYLDRIIEAGFDGVYLDRVDAFEAWSAERGSAERDMVAFVKSISAYAKARRPGFLIVPQNGEELLVHADYRSAIDAVAKEDLLYGLAGDEIRNSEDDVASTLAFLDQARAARLPVLVVEYLRDSERRFEAAARLDELGFLALFTSRKLNLPPEPRPARSRPAAVGTSPPPAVGTR